MHLIHEKERVSITIHREAYRYNLGKFNSKEYDISTVSTGDKEHDTSLKEKNVSLDRTISWTLNGIKPSGYKVGFALEPGTNLENISPYIVA